MLCLCLGNTVLLTAILWMWLRLFVSMQGLLVVLYLQISIIKTANSIITASKENTFCWSLVRLLFRKGGFFWWWWGWYHFSYVRISIGLDELFSPFNKAMAVKVSVLGKFSDLLSFLFFLKILASTLYNYHLLWTWKQNMKMHFTWLSLVYT